MNADQIIARLNKEGPTWAKQNRSMVLGWLRKAYCPAKDTPEQRAKILAFCPSADLGKCDVFEIILDECIRQCESQPATCPPSRPQERRSFRGLIISLWNEVRRYCRLPALSRARFVHADSDFNAA